MFIVCVFQGICLCFIYVTAFLSGVIKIADESPFSRLSQLTLLWCFEAIQGLDWSLWSPPFLLWSAFGKLLLPPLPTTCIFPQHFPLKKNHSKLCLNYCLISPGVFAFQKKMFLWGVGEGSTLGNGLSSLFQILVYYTFIFIIVLKSPPSEFPLLVG